jgi:hypothetical protein
MRRDASLGMLTRRRLLGWGGASLLGGAVASGSPAALAASKAATRPIEVSAKAIAKFHRGNGAERRFGRLEFRGGLVLSSSDAEFGGWSGLVIEPDGQRLFAISDEGAWLSARLVYSANAPCALTEARMGPIPARNGRALDRKRDADAEAIVLVEGNLHRGVVLIAYERNHRIARHPIHDGVLGAPTTLVTLPPDARRMRSNKGLEALTILQGGPHRGAIIAFSERYPDNDALHTGWLWVGAEPRRLTIPDIGGYEVTDVASLVDGSLLVLERRFRWTEGVRLRLRRFEAASVRPGAMPTGEILLEADMGHEIDNMEGLAVHRAATGETVLTLVSDNNFNTLLQRTVLLQFTLVDGARPA